ncbi:unnamed protein product [Sphenostylis stenocarpa]|uniref:DNA-directed RNA polymerase n=1 Tax=Sphenostylis stenocarpa TaxID=92480 RepID=A0AA86W676_9FABA|nr:unnamed protein product [Sphenostylis stenocarpa]
MQHGAPDREFGGSIRLLCSSVPSHTLFSAKLEEMNRGRTEGITFTKEPFMEDAGPRKIKNMKFSMLSESEISKLGEVQVWKGSYYDSFKKPIHGGLLDPRMESYVLGYLNLALPVLNVGCLGIIVEILKCICKDAHLNIDANIVKESILQIKKTKLKPEHIKILDIKKLRVVPQDADRSKLHFQLHYLKNLLPTLVVKGIKTADRVVISKEDKTTKAEKFKLLLEGLVHPVLLYDSWSFNPIYIDVWMHIICLFEDCLIGWKIELRGFERALGWCYASGTAHLPDRLDLPELPHGAQSFFALRCMHEMRFPGVQMIFSHQHRAEAQLKGKEALVSTKY